MELSDPGAIVSVPNVARLSIHIDIMGISESPFRSNLSHVLSCNRVKIADIMALSTEGSNPVPLVLVCDVVMNPHELLPVFPGNHVSLMSVTGLFSISKVYVGIASGQFVTCVLVLSEPISAGTPGLSNSEGWSPSS